MALNDDLTRDMSKSNKKISTKQIVLLCSGGFAAVLAIIGICVMLSPFGQYNLGISALNKGKYESAVKHLTAAGAYRDAQTHLMEATVAWNYEQAQQAFAAEDYATAMEKYGLTPGYLDSDSQLALSIICYHYQQGNLLFDSGDYLAASEEFEKIRDYQDSAERLEESYYLYATALAGDGDYLSAAEYYKLAPNHSDSAEEIYNCGMNLFEAGDYSDASTVFSYSDFEDAYQWQRYSSGWANYENGNYSAATEYFRVASGIGDADSLRVETAYLAGLEELEDGNYDDARDYFLAAPSYEDSDQMLLNCDLMLAEEDFRSGNLYSARNAYMALPSDLVYNDISVADRLAILDQYSAYVDICGWWTSTSGSMSSTYYGHYYTEGWSVDEVTGDTLSIRCFINDDGSVTIEGRTSYDIFTGYSSSRDLMVYYWDFRNYNFTIDNAVLGETWEIRSTATLSYSNGTFHLVDFVEDNPYAGAREEYITDVYFSELPDYERY